MHPEAALWEELSRIVPGNYYDGISVLYALKSNPKPVIVVYSRGWPQRFLFVEFESNSTELNGTVL